LNLDPSLAGFGETNPLSSLFINGSAPSLAFNPYTSSPYPIGLHYASGTGGGAEAPTLTAPFYNTDKYFSGDLALAFQNDEISIDVSLNDADRDPSIISAILISLLTDKRAAEYDTLPSEDSDRRGWWADAFQADNIGSKLWLLERSKVTSEVLAKFKHYTKEALDWMIEDGIATDIEVDATIVSPDAISLEVMIYRPRDP
jgi:phage gp46-like protein